MDPALFLFAVVVAPAATDQTIVVTAARVPVGEEDTPASASVLDEQNLRLLDLPLAGDALRLLPGVAVATSGPPGSQTQIRIRGSEANHTLLFMDGIRLNDPAAGNEARFELLTNDALAHLEVVRGPQSALWGSEALGGVVAVETADPRHRRAEAEAEYGDLDSARASVRLASGSSPVSVAANAGWIRSGGIDATGATGDHDGFWNRSASLKAEYRPSRRAGFGIVGHAIEGNSQFDGFDPLTFKRADTLDSTANRLAAGRAWAELSWGDSPADPPRWDLRFGGSLLDSRNRNKLDRQRLNSTFGTRASMDGQLSSRFGALGAEHRLIVATEYEDERFRARDEAFYGASDQDRSRNQTALTAEWRADWRHRLVTDVAVRRDWFSAFTDATTLRASLLYHWSRAWSTEVSYGEGIAQPSFYDLYGFFPGSFVGNPSLRPERSRSWEAGVRWKDRRTSLAMTAFAADLSDEIVDVFDPATSLASTTNAMGKSHRRGVELEGERRIGPATVRVAYSFLDADERSVPDASRVREVRRPRHNGSLVTTVPLDRFSFGAGIAYVGKRTDTDFDSYPARRVSLGSYLLASVNAAVSVTDKWELYARLENALDDRYQDVLGYATPGRTIHAGLRLHLGR